MKPSRLKELFEKYTSGTATPEEHELVEKWLGKVDRQPNEWNDLDAEKKQSYMDGLYNDVSDTIDDGLRHEIKKKGTHNYAWLAAAIGLLLAGLFGFLYLRHPDRPSEAYIVQKTLPGKMKKVMLNDGSQVWMNAGTELRYPEKFAGPEREVFLKGEAFFNIRHNGQQPFIVYCGSLRVRVLGTSFNVQDYQQDSLVQVAVLSGRVQLQDSVQQSSKVLVSANELASYQKASRQISKTTSAHIRDYTAWQNGKLIFDHTPMSMVIASLERSTGREFIIRNKAINNCRITGSFELDEPFNLMIEAICASIDAHYSIQGNQVIIDGSGC